MPSRRPEVSPEGFLEFGSPSAKFLGAEIVTVHYFSLEVMFLFPAPKARS